MSIINYPYSDIGTSVLPSSTWCVHHGGTRAKKERGRKAERQEGRKEGSECGGASKNRSVEKEVDRVRVWASLRGETKNTRKSREPSASPSRRRSPVEIHLRPRGLLSLPSHSAFAQFTLNRIAFSDTIRCDAPNRFTARSLAHSLARSFIRPFAARAFVWDANHAAFSAVGPTARSARCSALVSGPTFSPSSSPLRLAIPTAFAAPSSTPPFFLESRARNRVPRKRTRGCLRRWW